MKALALECTGIQKSRSNMENIASLRQEIEYRISCNELRVNHNENIEYKALYRVKFADKSYRRTTMKGAIEDTKTGLYNTVYLININSTEAESDSMRESAYQTDDEKKLKDAKKKNIATEEDIPKLLKKGLPVDELVRHFAKKSFKERLENDYPFEYSESLKEQPAKVDKNIDKLDFWFVGLTDPEMTTVYKVDATRSPIVIYNLTEEFYARKHHDAKTMTQEEKDWATVLGWEGDIRNEIKWFMNEYPTNEERLAFANGTSVELLGTTATPQVVICPNPECGRPTHASPVMQAYTDPQAKTVPFEVASQMVCPHCGTPLFDCFSFNEGELINVENYVANATDLDDDEDIED